MELKFTIKIKDKQSPPIFNKELGNGVLETIVIDFKDMFDEDLENNPMFICHLHELMNKFKDEWIEVNYEKI